MIASNAHSVGKHSFYPLIKSVLTSVKLSREKSTRKIKRERKDRPIAYAAHVDSQIYAYYAHQINESYEIRLNELGLSDCVLAFRKLGKGTLDEGSRGKGNIDFADEVFREISERKNCEVGVFDIHGFFDNLDHRRLKRAWQDLLGVGQLPKDHYAVFRSVTRWSFVEKKPLFKALGISVHNSKALNRKRICDPKAFREVVRPLIQVNEKPYGIPQGTPISAVLSNVYLLDFDSRMKGCADKLGSRYFRYCDDMIVVCPPGKLAEMKAELQSGIADAKLEFQEKKTSEPVFSENDGIVSASVPLQYWRFRSKPNRIPG